MYQPSYQYPNYGFIARHHQGTPNYNMQPYMGQMWGGYYPTGQGHGVYNNKPYVNQAYLGAWNQMPKPRLPFLTILNLPDLLILTNDLVSHDPAWLVVPSNLPSDIPNFKDKSGEDPGEHATVRFSSFKLELWS